MHSNSSVRFANNDANNDGNDATLSRAAWQSRYDEKRTGWDRGEPNPMMFSWLTSAELRPCRILIPGCGRGHEVVALSAAGFDVTAVDFADSAVAELTAELASRSLSATVVQSDIFAFESLEPFAAIYDQTCLCAIHPDRWATYERRLHNWLRPGGNLFSLFMQADKPDGPPFHCDLEHMKNLFLEDRWQWPNSTQRVDHPTGMSEIACVLTRKETAE